jgi:hypothetical protein
MAPNQWRIDTRLRGRGSGGSVLIQKSQENVDSGEDVGNERLKRCWHLVKINYECQNYVRPKRLGCY